MSKRNETNIFIVEDNKIFTLALKADIETVFKYMPIKIHAFETGEACMKKFNHEKPQIVILDYHLNTKFPQAANGIQVLDWIKEEDKETNVIMLTGDDDLEVALKSFKHGASDYVVKTETKFKKINYSLFNLFKIIEKSNEAKKYKQMVFALVSTLVLVVVAVMALHTYAPGLF